MQFNLKTYTHTHIDVHQYPFLCSKILITQSYFFQSLSTFQKNVRTISFSTIYLINSFEFAYSIACVVVFVVLLCVRSDFHVSQPHSILCAYEICLYLIFELYILSLTDYKSTYIQLAHIILQYTQYGHWPLFIGMQLQRTFAFHCKDGKFYLQMDKFYKFICTTHRQQPMLSIRAERGATIAHDPLAIVSMICGNVWPPKCIVRNMHVF